MQETWVRVLGLGDPLEKKMATHSSILAWKIPWAEEFGGFIVHGVYRVEHNLATKPPDHLQGQVMGFPGGSDSKESACNTGDQGSTPGLERSPGEGNGNQL